MNFYFALVDAGTAWSAALERVDLDVPSFVLSENEGEFASLQLTIRNPRIGLLNAARKQWLWFAIADGSTDGAEPLFFGRIVGVPQEPQGNLVTVTYVARPGDIEDLKSALAETLKVHPWWDAAFVDAARRADPEAVLDARTARWHIDRVSHAVTISDTITGEDGTIDFAGEFIRDSLSVQVGEPAVRRVHVEMQADWEQKAKGGGINLSPMLLSAAQAAGSGNGIVIETYTGEGLAADWPQKGDDIGAGWSFGLCEVIRGDKLWIPDPDNAQVELPNTTVAFFPLWSFKPVLGVKYDCSRSRSEKLTFDLHADVQALLAEPTEDQVVLQIALSSSDIQEPIDPPYDTDGTGVTPLHNPAARSYFKTARGHRSLEYAIALARKELLERARAVTISFEVAFALGLDLSCRKNARVADPRLPGGEAAGKIIAYALSGDGDSGVFSAKITIGCMIGNGNTVTEDAGTPDYCEDGYVADGYQTRTGEVIMPIAGEVTYTNYGNHAIHDDGIDFTRMTPARVVRSLTIIDGKREQKAVLDAIENGDNNALSGIILGADPASNADAQTVVDALNQVFTEIDLKLKPLNTGPFETDFAITVSELMVPKTIDLAAASS